MKEHVPKWALLNADKIAKSSITEHIINEGHPCDKNASFEILHKARNSRSLQFIEAVAIRKLKPQLNVQKMLDFKLQLPWS